MDQNTEYEKLAREIYKQLSEAQGINTIDIKHDVKLTGNSGQKHQIDVYWEYKMDGVQHSVIIECKNYNRKISVEKVNAFRGLLDDFTGVKGIMITKKGYQSGAKKIADSCGIKLKELRSPNEEDDCRIAETKFSFTISLTQRLFSLDNDWAKANNINWLAYRNLSASLSQRGDEWGKDYLPLETIGNEILDEKGHVVTTLDKLADELPQKAEYIFDFKNAYVNTRNFGKVKIKTVKYINSETSERRLIILDAKNITKAILKDAFSGKIEFFMDNL